MQNQSDGRKRACILHLSLLQISVVFQNYPITKVNRIRDYEKLSNQWHLENGMEMEVIMKLILLINKSPHNCLHAVSCAQWGGHRERGVMGAFSTPCAPGNPVWSRVLPVQTAPQVSSFCPEAGHEPERQRREGGDSEQVESPRGASVHVSHTHHASC